MSWRPACSRGTTRQDGSHPWHLADRKECVNASQRYYLILERTSVAVNSWRTRRNDSEARTTDSMVGAA